MTQAQESTGRLLAGRYRLKAVLGSGGMGTVWRAEDEMLGRIVAVKELRMHGGVDEEEKHRLIVRTLREAKATARIRHTAAVTVFDVVEEDERPWIVMELVESRSLAEVIKEDGPLTPVRAAEIALDLLGVLGAAHSHGILHRDVKPSNVLIGEDGRVVLTDFGIASVEGDTSITSTGMLVGAPSYISPERAKGHKPGPPSDLWSLGGTLYAMVEGKPPYDRGSALATLTAVMTEDLPASEKAGPLWPVIEGLLEKDPALRLDASETRSRLKRIVAAGVARAEATTQQAVPVKPADGSSAAEPEQASKSGAKAESTSGSKPGSRPGSASAPKSGSKPAAAAAAGAAAVVPAQQAGAKPGSKPVAEDASKDGRAGAIGLLGTVRVGSRSASAPAPIPAPPLTVPAAPAAPAPVTEVLPPVPAAAKDRRRLKLAVGAVVFVLALIAVVALAMRGGGKGTDGAAARSGPGTAAGAAPGTQAGPESPAAQSPAAGAGGQSAATTPPPASAPAAGAGSPAASASGTGQPNTGTGTGTGAGSGTGTGAGAVPPAPAGYRTYRDPSGFSINLPDWLTDQGPDYDATSRQFKGNGVKLMVDWTSPAHGSAYDDWVSSEKDGNGGSNYQRVDLKAITYRQWTNAADWEWTFGSKTRMHSLNRGFVTGDGKYGYALYWTVPDADWGSAANADARRVGFESFQPAP
ncbi:serine/threonine-protein kinase [Kitasatospora sp. NPDC049258]|uniref:serine/threonine-protein kinase n=1 Tax=Kitasatospora sp. NPDC049258 TaxID=3155394 RepID=UPI00344369B5